MSLEQAREWLRSATAVAVLTGAGISAESGIPTFRGTGGLWRDYKPEDLATPEAFARDPRLVWEWYNWRRAAIQQAKPNAGHAALVRLEIQNRQTGNIHTIVLIPTELLNHLQVLSSELIFPDSVLCLVL